METIFWTTIAAAVIGGIIVLIVEYFGIQPLAKKYQEQGKPAITGFRSVITKLATISPASISKVVISFLVGIIFTIAIAKLTNTNLANIDFLGSHPSSCGFYNTGIVGQLINNNSGYATTVTTSPPTSSAIVDENGYFSICGISLSDGEQQFTVTAKSDWSEGSVDIGVLSNKTAIAIIQMHRTGH